MALAATALAGLTAPAAAGPLLDIDRIEPYFVHGAVGRARDALEIGRPAKAVPILRRYVRRRSARHRDQARFLLGLALLRANQPAEAAQVFAQLVGAYPLLADYHLFYRAKALSQTGRWTEAAREAGRVGRRSTLRTSAQLLRASALRVVGRHDEVLSLWRDYLARYPQGRRAGEAHFRMAESYQAKAKRAAKAARADLQSKALDHYKQTLVRSPLGRFAHDAEKRIEQLGGKVTGKRPADLSTEQNFARSVSLYRRMRHRQAERGFTAVLGAAGLGQERRCLASYYRANAVFRLRERRRAEPLFAKAITACREAGLTDILVKCLFQHGRCLYSKGQYKAAAERWLGLEKEFPGHSYADDARIFAAEAHAELGDKQQVVKLLSALPKRHPRGDQAREAIWRLARDAYLAGDHLAALRHLDHSIDKLGRTTLYYEEGRALYWKGRVLGKLGKRAQAARAYERAIREYPLSYYALLGFNRLRESHPRQYRRLFRELIAPIGRKRGHWRFRIGALARNISFKKGVELARLGLGGAAARELARAGLADSSTTRPGRRWLAAALFDRAKIWRKSHRIPNRFARSFKRSYPLDSESFQKWRIAYPWAFGAHVRREASRNKLPAQLVLSIMREESGFTPRIESWANAMGLMQLIMPTAKRAARRYRMRVDRQALQEPAINIKLGAYFLGWLFDTFRRTPPLAVAGYNAGQGAVYRWLQNYASNSLDELVERIPYDQTRRYTKRVLASYFAFSVLYPPKRIPRIGLGLPQKLEPGPFGQPPPRKHRPRRGKRHRSRRR